MLILFLQLGKAKSPNNKKELGGFSMTLQDSCFIKRTFPFIKQSKTERTRYPFHVTLLCTACDKTQRIERKFCVCICPSSFPQQLFSCVWPPGGATANDRSFGRAGTSLDESCPTQGPVAKCRSGMNRISALSRA